MSLDVYLTMPEREVGPRREAIFVRENGSMKEISREEWDARHPDREPVTCEIGGRNCVYDANITHNLGKMADMALIYKPLWRPEEIGISTANQLIGPLREGLTRLKADPKTFKTRNPANGWGTYEDLVAFVENYLAACEEFPQAEVSVSG